MQLNTVIFDMDGVLIDSEPFWMEAGVETLAEFNISLTQEQYHLTTGLRTKEWIDHWFTYFRIDKSLAQGAEDTTHRLAIEKIGNQGISMPGVAETLAWFREQRFRIGLATSSPMALVDVVLDKLGIREYFSAITSAEFIPYGKPHPQVYMDCAKKLQALPMECICFEDSFNGMIAAKAARMKCIVLPAADQYELAKWGAADRKLRSLLEFNGDLLKQI